MEILLNDQKLDFKLENETVLHEIVDGISSWSQQDNYHIQDVYFDDKLYSFDSDEDRNTPIKNVSVIKVTAKSIFKLHQENLQLLYQYVSLFLKSLESSNIKLLNDLKADAQAVTALLSEFLEEKKGAEESVSSLLLKNIKTIDPQNIQTSDKTFTDLLRQLTSLKIILHERISELGDPIGELSKTVSAMKTSGSEINDISVLLQTGKDREALGVIIKFSELNQKVLRLYPILKNEGFIDFEELTVDGTAFSDFYTDFNGIMNELIEAFTADDSVLIGDLLEYETAPMLEQLIVVLEDVLKRYKQ